MTTALDLNIKWEVFHESERALLEQAITRGDIDHLAAIIYEVTPDKAEEIEKIQRQLRPNTFTFESEVQKEAEAWMIANYNDLTPEKEAEFQAKIDAEKAEKMALMGGDITKVETLSSDGTAATNLKVSSDLKDVRGLGEASIKRLNAANIFSLSEFKALNFQKLKEIVGPIVANNFKDLIK